ncbi:XamI family restriction endonuclease [Nitrolancea hollandica]|uniref:Type-2 restriction enzyme SalI n=1 Tax=Nitrolancea hollandica Lb TaxID=1129897 RepID=I4EKI5_9BACT|nr:XamI family restriction endonuclease [Nitrolancea hollandica]CCF85197.1 Type-2 restriction enzyme SalI [Nitrolancea hollandica Lb]
MINADKPNLWKKDTALSVDLYNNWFIQFAPPTFRASRVEATMLVKHAFELTNDLESIAPETLLVSPQVLPILRMCTAPPLARDRLVGLSNTTKNLVGNLEAGRLPPRMPKDQLQAALTKISETILRLLDVDLFPWLSEHSLPSEQMRDRSAMVVADRLTGANADPLIRNAQEQRQLDKLRQFLVERGYKEEQPPPGSLPTAMPRGTFWFRLNVRVGAELEVNIPIDAVIQPKGAPLGAMPILIEAKSAGDFTNVNKRRKEEATKNRQLQERYGDQTKIILLLAGYFDAPYLGYEAAEGLDWVWEHRIQDLDQVL